MKRKVGVGIFLFSLIIFSSFSFASASFFSDWFGQITGNAVRAGESCTDSDGGINEFVMGVISYRGKTRQDSCNWYDTRVKEGYCNERARARIKTVRCEFGCFEGVCLQDRSRGEDSRLYGDVNLDGNVTATDSLMVFKYLEGSLDLEDEQKSNADVNLDKKVTVSDVVLILHASVGKVQLPITSGIIYEGSVPRNIDPPSVYGDVNLDGNVTATDALLALRYSVGLEELSDSSIMAADVNLDDVINEDDAILIMKKERLPIFLLGDLDSDGNISSTDALIVLRAGEGIGDLSTNQKIRADMNSDGNVRIDDLREILRRAVA